MNRVILITMLAIASTLFGSSSAMIASITGTAVPAPVIVCSTQSTQLLIGQSLPCGSTYSVQLENVQAVSTGLYTSTVSSTFNVYYKGVLYSTLAISANSQKTVSFGSSVVPLTITVGSSALAGYQNTGYAQLQAFTGIRSLRDGSVFNQSPGWNAQLLWTNTSPSGGNAIQLQSIIAYNTTPTTLTPGHVLPFILNPNVFSEKFVGTTSPNAYDPLNFRLSSSSMITYQNNLGNGQSGPSNITEPAQLLTVTSSIVNSFAYGAQQSSQLQYILTPYQLITTQNPNTINLNPASAYETAALSTYNNGVDNGNFINTNNPLTVTIRGYPSYNANSQIVETLTFTSGGAAGVIQKLPTNLYNVTSVQVSRTLPNGGPFITVSLVGNEPVGSYATLAFLAPTSQGILYNIPGRNYYGLYQSGVGTLFVSYNQQNGQPLMQLSLASTATTTQQNQYFGYSIRELPAPSNTQMVDLLVFGLYNTSIGSSPGYQFESYTGVPYNVTYFSTQQTGTGAYVNAKPGFVTERGSQVLAAAPYQYTLGIATVVNQMQFEVGAVPLGGTGTYNFAAPIGSVMNRALLLGLPANTKSLQGDSNDAYLETSSLTTVPAPSPYSAVGVVPIGQPVTPANGGGISFTSFQIRVSQPGNFYGNTYDNILQITNQQLPALLYNYGTHSETESLWLTGFPVFNQQLGSLALMDAGGAYQATFNNPIAVSAPKQYFTLLGANWTILGFTVPGALSPNTTATSVKVSPSNVVNGGQIMIGNAATPQTTVNMGQSLTFGNFRIQVVNFMQPGGPGAPVVINVYYNGVLTNSTTVQQGGIAFFNVSGNRFAVKVGTTFEQMQLKPAYAYVSLLAEQKISCTGVPPGVC